LLVRVAEEKEVNSVTNITKARKTLVTRILEGDGKASRAQRRVAFDNAGLTKPLNMLIDKVAKHAYQVTEEDIAAARASGLSEDQIFEIVVCAAIGQASRQYDQALQALEAATREG
jgi:hypothetical protein